MPGANPETMASTVATPLERQFSTIAGIQSMSSTNSQGATTITVQFDLSRNIDAAAQDIQAAISRRRRPAAAEHAAAAHLLEGQSGRTAHLLSRGHFAHAAAYTRSPNTPTHLLAQRISMVSGVSRVQVFGEQKYAVRVQVDPDQLAAHNIGIDEVQKAIASANTNLPTGRLAWRCAGLHHRIERLAVQRGGIPAGDRGLPQRRAGTAGATGQRCGWRGERAPDRAGSTTCAA